MAKKQEVGKGRTQVKDLPPKKRDLNKAEQKRIKGGIAPLTRGIMIGISNSPQPSLFR